MQQHISDAKNIWKLFLFNAIYGVCIQGFILCCLNLFMQSFQPTGDKTTCATGKIGHLFPDLWVDHLRHKISHGARRVKFTRRASTLQFFQNRFVNFSESMTFFIFTKINIINIIDDFTEQNTIFHIVVGICKSSLHYCFLDGCRSIHRQLFQGREQRIVDKFQQGIACHALAVFIMRPIAPSARLWKNRLITTFIPYPIVLFCVIHF